MSNKIIKQSSAKPIQPQISSFFKSPSSPTKINVKPSSNISMSETGGKNIEKETTESHKIKNDLKIEHKEGVMEFTTPVTERVKRKIEFDDNDENKNVSNLKRARIDSSPDLNRKAVTPVRLPSPSSRFNSISQSPKKIPLSQSPTKITPSRPIYSSPSSVVPSVSTPTSSNVQRFQFLEHRIDGQKHPPDHADYDPSTLYISSTEFQKLTPFERQYWLLKKDRMDMVMFFQKGRFYELYEEDADIGAMELDLKMTNRVNMRLCGIPEIKFTEWAKKLTRSLYLLFYFIICSFVYWKFL
jgi:hypothetical protein